MLRPISYEDHPGFGPKQPFYFLSVPLLRPTRYEDQFLSLMRVVLIAKLLYSTSTSLIKAVYKLYRISYLFSLCSYCKDLLVISIVISLVCFKFHQ